METLFINGLIAHLIGDWLLQTENIAINKHILFNKASIIHMLVHLTLLIALTNFSFIICVLISLIHGLIDTRKVLDWWMKNIKFTDESNGLNYNVRLWVDQVFHIVIIWFFATIV